jgi:hypothetical protein
MSLTSKPVTVALALFLAICVASIVLTHRKAKMLLEDIENLSTAPDPSSSLPSLKKKYGGQFTLKSCGPDTYTGRGSLVTACSYGLHINNQFVSRLHLMHKTELDVGFVEVQGLLVQVGVEYFSGQFPADSSCELSSPCVWIEEDFCPDAIGPGGAFIPSNGETGTEPWAPCHGIRVEPRGRDKTPTFYGVVNLGYWTTEEEKRAALGLNLNCLFSIRGCKDVSELLPTIWQRTGPGAISSRFAIAFDGSTSRSIY